MTEEIVVGTPVAGENVHPVTEADKSVDNREVSSEKVTAPNGPTVEQRDGKLFVDGTRVYTRDDTNRIAARAKEEVESRILQDLEVDDLGQVKKVVNQLRSATPESNSLDVESLRSAIQKREQTVEELKAELSKVKTDFAVKEHVSLLKDNMPTTWKPEQKDAVVDLMKARNMFQVEGNTFAIKNGDDFLTVDGERPDYKSAVELVGKSLGLPFAKRGVETYDSDTGVKPADSSRSVDEARLKSDPIYRNAYIQFRDSNKSLRRDQITDSMVKKHAERINKMRGYN